MKPSVLTNAIAFVGLVLGLSACATRDASRIGSVPVYQGAPETGAPAAQAPLVTYGAAAESAWPLQVVAGRTNITIYQPEIDGWDGHLLTARSAVMIQSPAPSIPVYGVVALRGITLVDKAQRSVTLDDPTIVTVDFPSVAQGSDRYLELLRDKMPKEIKGLSLDRLETSLALPVADQRRLGQPLNNTPPAIVVFTRPALLVSIDGPLNYRPVPGTDLQRVINTPQLLLRDKAGRQYLRVSEHAYLVADSLNGPWSWATNLPPGIAEAERSLPPGTSLSGTEPSSSPDIAQNETTTHSMVPAVYVATKPTELITFDGEPEFVPLAGTHLLYVTNTTANVFKSLTDQRTYVLLAGRWFSAPSLAGPWEYVPGSKLPSDFAAIPDNSPKENVKASVPGTPQATEALIANSIPQSGKVDRTVQMQDPQIDGPAQLRPIEGTPLSYVANSGTPVLRVNDQSWYACQNGVWFSAPSVNGPWTVATSVPPVIYTIPVTSPLHYLTYVRVYGSTPDTVYEGYTPGYFGTEISPEGTVVYGTGYPYPAWIGNEWYGGPITWGYGWDPFWTPWDDWAFGFGFGWGCGYGRFGWWRCHPPVPRWGPYRHWPHDRGFAGHSWHRDGWVHTGGKLYSGSGVRAGAANRGFRGLPPGATFGRAYNSRTGALVAGRREDLARINTIPRASAGGTGSWNGRSTAWRGGGSSWPSHGTLSDTFHTGNSLPSAGNSKLPFSSSGQSGRSFALGRSLPFNANRSFGSSQAASHAFQSWDSPSHGYGTTSSSSRGSFGYGGGSFSFPHSGGSLSFPHSGAGGFFHGGSSSGSGGGVSHSSSFFGGHGGSSFGGGHSGGSSGGGHGGGGGGHR